MTRDMRRYMTDDELFLQENFREKFNTIIYKKKLEHIQDEDLGPWCAGGYFMDCLYTSPFIKDIQVWEKGGYSRIYLANRMDSVKFKMYIDNNKKDVKITINSNYKLENLLKTVSGFDEFFDEFKDYIDFYYNPKKKKNN